MNSNIKVQELLNKDSWTKACNARDVNNKAVDIDSPEACRWCLWGAIMKCYPEKKNEIRIEIENRMNRILTAWNDEPIRTWQDIEQLIKEFDL